MKATYQKPLIEETDVELTSLMEASNLPEKVEDGFDPGSTPTTNETSGNLSRRNIWGDE